MAKLYGPRVTVTKKECVGHVAKPLYSRMKYLLQKGAVDARGAKVRLVGSKGVTQKKHARNGYFLQRSDTSDVGNVDGMANDTMAIFYHCSSTETKKSQHQLCPKGRVYMVKIQ